MLIDDTVFFASSRERFIEEMNVLHEFCETHGMVVNKIKTKFMVIHGTDEDRESIHLDDLIILLCEKYVESREYIDI